MIRQTPGEEGRLGSPKSHYMAQLAHGLRHLRRLKDANISKLIKSRCSYLTG